MEGTINASSSNAKMTMQDSQRITEFIVFDFSYNFKTLKIVFRKKLTAKLFSFLNPV